MDQNDKDAMRDASALAHRLAKRVLEVVSPRDMKDRDAIVVSLSALAGAYAQACVAAGVTLEKAIDGIREAWPSNRQIAVCEKCAGAGICSADEDEFTCRACLGQGLVLVVTPKGDVR